MATSIAGFATLIPLLIVANISPMQYCLPASYIVCGLSLVSFYFIKYPNSWMSYTLLCINSISKSYLNVLLSAYYARNLPKEVRGVLWSISWVVTLFGKLISFKVAKYLFSVSAYWPFMFEGICILSVGVLIIIAFSLGYYERQFTKDEKEALVNSIFEKIQVKLK